MMGSEPQCQTPHLMGVQSFKQGSRSKCHCKVSGRLRFLLSEALRNVLCDLAPAARKMDVSSSLEKESKDLKFLD